MNRLKEITKGDMPTVVIDATGNLKAINTAFQYIAHGGRYVLVGLQKDEIHFNHPEFHKREATLMSSRNATRNDFEHVMYCIQKGFINPATYITHRVEFKEVKNHFKNWLNPDNRVMKAMIEMS
jgi:threonine dehydrogenase-like Zn-dependent dehydrogenase